MFKVKYNISDNVYIMCTMCIASTYYIIFILINKNIQINIVLHTHIHTHTYIYIYIYIYRGGKGVVAEEGVVAVLINA